MEEHEFEIEQMQADLTDRKETLNSERNRLLALRADLENRNGQFTVAGRQATENEVRAELKSGFSNYLKGRSIFEARLEILSTKKNHLQDARNQLSKLIAQKKSLDLELDSIEATLQLSKIGDSPLNFAEDETQLKRFEEIIDHTRRRIEHLDEEDGESDLSLPDLNIERMIDLYFSSKIEGHSIAFLLGAMVDSEM